MARPVLGTDPFATTKPAAAGADPATSAAEPAGEQPAASRPARKPATAVQRPRPKRAPRRRAPRTRPVAPPRPADEVAAKLTDLERRLDERMAELDGKLGAALTTLERAVEVALESSAPAPRSPEGSEEPALIRYLDDDDIETVEVDADTDAAETEVAPAIDDDMDDDEDENGEVDADDDAFVGFLRDAPADGDDDSGDGGDSFSDSSLDVDERGDRAPSLLGSLRDLLTPTGLGRRLGDFGLRGISDEVDEFGKDPVYIERVIQLFDWLYQKYWRVESEGLENVPETGRALIVGNHSGTLPFDGVMIATAVRLHHSAERDARALIEDMFGTLPFVAPFMSRVGAVRGCQENAERLLNQDELVVVFPEGVKGAGKYYRQRYQLQRFGRGGFIKLCLRTGSPLIPTAVLGAEETYPIIAKADWLGKPLGLPYTPITPTFPWLGLLGLVPMPTKWRIQFGEPMHFDDYGPDALEDDILINHLKEEVRNRIQDMLDEMLAERNSVWFG